MSDDRHLDGNAVGGLLNEVFGREMTSARGCCDGCGAINPMAAVLAFTEAPGVVLRCPNCQSVLVVAVRTDRAVRVSFSRLRWIEPAE
jgi:hypothetical protein